MTAIQGTFVCRPVLCMRRDPSVRHFRSSSIPVVLTLLLGCLHQAHAMPPSPTTLVERRAGDEGARPSEGSPLDSTIAVETTDRTKRGECLGVMVAPRVGLTAGHCVSESAKITVHAATVGGSKKVVAVDRFWTDPTRESSNGLVDMDASDIAILVLAEPLPMRAYARYAHASLDEPSAATGMRHRENLIETLGISLRPAERARYYRSSPIGAPGDSGSPVFVGNGADRTVMGVLAGTSPKSTVYARVDLVAHKLDELVVTTATPAIGRTSPAVAPKPSPAKRPTPSMPLRPPPPPVTVRWT